MAVTKQKNKEIKKPVSENKVVEPDNKIVIKNEEQTNDEQSDKLTPKTKLGKQNSKKDFISGTGRRKTSTARVFLYQTKGDFTINGIKAEEYFPSDIDKVKWEKPFHAIGVSHPEAKFSATIKVTGSGKPSQLDAVILGISRALAKVDIEFDKILRKQGFMTRDSRMVERKKPFLHKARKRPQYSKR
jgi:small subunit ribosomal protein S9